MKYIVTGGIYHDFTFKDIQDQNVESYGPFDTYEEASVQWKSKMWANVDNALHKLQIVKVYEESEKRDLLAF